jgi:hypothetical protein
MKFYNIIAAYKRANYFCKDMPIMPFSMVRINEKPVIAATNYQWLLDEIDKKNDCESYLEDLCILSMWADYINRYIDENRIEDNELAKWSIACWRSRMFFDPIKLKG